MGDTGYIDWHRLSQNWANTGTGSTFVYAFWPVDTDYYAHDHGVSLLKRKDAHPDWFLRDPIAAGLLFSVGHDQWHTSPNADEVYDEHRTSVPLLGSLLLGTSDSIYAAPNNAGHWWAAYTDLTRPGRKLVEQTSTLYLRPAVLITFLNIKPMSETDPETTATRPPS